MAVIKYAKARDGFTLTVNRAAFELIAETLEDTPIDVNAIQFLTRVQLAKKMRYALDHVDAFGEFNSDKDGYE